MRRRAVANTAAGWPKEAIRCIVDAIEVLLPRQNGDCHTALHKSAQDVGLGAKFVYCVPDDAGRVEHVLQHYCSGSHGFDLKQYSLSLGGGRPEVSSFPMRPGGNLETKGTVVPSDLRAGE